MSLDCPDSLVTKPDIPGEKRAIALRQLYSAESTCSLFSLSTWSWKTLTWSMKDTTRSADMGDEWNPAAASRGAMCRGRADCAAFRMKSSLQLSLSSATCRVIQQRKKSVVTGNIYNGSLVFKSQN